MNGALPSTGLFKEADPGILGVRDIVDMVSFKTEETQTAFLYATLCVLQFTSPSDARSHLRSTNQFLSF